MIKKISMKNIGPSPSMELEFGERLNLITGDNGLGKSFLLDIAWWAMTRSWPGEVNPKLSIGKIALPTIKKETATIRCSFSGRTNDVQTSFEYDAKSESWRVPRGRPGMPGLVFYAMVDGSFAVWDPARNYWKERGQPQERERPSAYIFSPKEVWDGLERDDGTWLCNGLIRDWAGWQKEKGRPFEILKSVLKELSPVSGERLEPGKLTRISLDDVRDMPTIRMPYEQDVPVVHCSSGMKRIIALAYFLVWCWEEHLKAKELLGEEPELNAIFLVDEVESHLHPKWQRTILRSIMDVMERLNTEAKTQIIAVTHSPLIMASAETLFDPEKDAWFDLDMKDGAVTLEKREFLRQGDISDWLTSQAFDLKSGYSLEAENAMEEASRLLSDETMDKNRAREIYDRLKTVLSDTDPFWIRWNFVADKKGWFR
ncbi:MULTISPECIES: AAA family ATPase [Dethiosulfovibrio]|uniref:AAA family ATPase n=2 Tax=Dethiosulfovibrio TaxID=47054 RepID=A0ABS9EN47_9BACT|nr:MULTISPECIES: ATP-binding protein [Dethiosulfovibrio]MCF4114191.1 AAA family ATPase [Dethiosulfovibrio russensis]MCF4142619.1 AAA family ATPase [Dethiosulfovibrio marinus]MCF4145138.1 AAA family ATPase [Dethiosulfovibrio acidaminovorans]